MMDDGSKLCPPEVTPQPIILGGGLVPIVHLCPGRGQFLETPLSRKHSLGWPPCLGSPLVEAPQSRVKGTTLLDPAEMEVGSDQNFQWTDFVSL